jgi:hypothetical protein
VNEDAGAQTVASWATNISAGPADESGQTLAFHVNNDNNGLFALPPAIASDGTLTYTLAANANGSTIVTVTLQDNGGTANGGIDTSASQPFTINVISVNDAPTLDTISDPVAISEDAGLQTVNLSGIGPGGGTDEATQTLTVTATSNNTALIPNPAVTYTSPNATGSLTYTPVGNANGTAVITVTVTDNGGTANGGADTFSRTFTVKLTEVNDSPVLLLGTVSDLTVMEDSGTTALFATPLVFGPGGGSDEAGQSLTYKVEVRSWIHGLVQMTNSSQPPMLLTGPHCSGKETFGMAFQSSLRRRAA